MKADEAKRAAFAAMVEELRGLGDARQQAERETQAGYDAALLVAARPTGKGKPPKNAEDAWKRLPEEKRRELRAEWEAKADAVSTSFRNRRTSLEEDLRALAEHVPVRPGTNRLTVEDRSTSTHRSTSRGADYARAGAQIVAEGLKGTGVEVAVEPYWYDKTKKNKHGPMGLEGPDGFRVVALVADKVDVEVLKRLPGVPIREWVRLCWKLGVNPRVYNPYLPHGFEEKAGLDFFGNDLRATGAAK